MAEFPIKDEDLLDLKGKFGIVTGGSSGIGLATTASLLSLGATVLSGDINPPVDPFPSLYFEHISTDVSSWPSLLALFDLARKQHSRIDFVFANAGIGPRANYLALERDAEGELQEPTHEVLDVNLRAVMNTATLAVHYMKSQPEGGSIVLMGSSTGLQALRAPDYSTAKHGVLGFGRGLARLLVVASLPVRVNTLMPPWTTTNVLLDMAGVMKVISHEAQPGVVVARAAALLLIDTDRKGDVIDVADGRYWEIEKAVLVPAYEVIKGEEKPSDEEVLEKILALAG